MHKAVASLVIMEPTTIARNPSISRMIVAPSKLGRIRLREPITREAGKRRSTTSVHQLMF